MVRPRDCFIFAFFQNAWNILSPIIFLLIRCTSLPLTFARIFKCINGKHHVIFAFFSVAGFMRTNILLALDVLLRLSLFCGKGLRTRLLHLESAHSLPPIVVHYMYY